MPQQLRVVRELDAAGAALIGLGATYPGNIYHVDKALGNDGNDGLGWGGDRALKTIQVGLDKCVGRAYHTVLVRGDGYSESLTTPLNATAPFGQLISMNPIRMGYNTYLTAAATDETILTVRARGWRISGFEFDLPLTGKGIDLDSKTSSCSANYTQIDNCLFNGQSNSTVAIDFNDQSNFVLIEDSIFYNIYNAGTTAQAIGSSNSDDDVANYPIVRRCHFSNNNRHIYLNGIRGFKYGLIEDCHFLNGHGVTADQYINMTNGFHNVVRRNTCAGTWSHAGGYVDATSDIWYENYQVDGAEQTTQPA